MQKLLTFFSAKILVYDQSFNDTLTNDIVSFEQLGPELKKKNKQKKKKKKKKKKKNNCK